MYVCPSGTIWSFLCWKIDQGLGEQVGGTVSLGTHGSLHGFKVEALRGKEKDLLFANNGQLREKLWTQCQLETVWHCSHQRATF